MKGLLSGKAGRAGHIGRALDTHIALPLFALLPLIAIWVATFHLIDAEREATLHAARDATREQIDTYEAQMVRNLTAIDQTLKVIKYSVEMNGARSALPALRRQGLLPPGLVFQVSVTDRDGHVVDGNPQLPAQDVSREDYFTLHAAGHGGMPFVSTAVRDAAKGEPHLHFTRRIDGADGRFAGIAIVEVDPAYFTSSYERSRDGERGLLALVGNDGIARAVRIGEQVSWGQRFASADLASDPDAPALPSVQPRPTAPDGLLRYASARRLHGFPLTAVVGLAANEQMSAFGTHRRTYLLAAFAASALLICVVALVSVWSWQLAKVRRRERRAQQTHLAASEASLDAVFVLRLVGDGAATHDFLIEDTNSRVENIIGFSREAARGRRLGELLPNARRNGMFDELLRVVTEQVVLEAEWRAARGPAAGRWLHRQFIPVEDGVVAMVRDITERKGVEERIRHMAHHDELTGLPNRSLIRDRLEQAVAQAHRTGGHLALAFIDLDGFKLVNDGLGHNAGDELLQVIGRRMGACLGAGHTLGRLGGDEFVILMPDVADSPLAVSPVLEQVRLAVLEPVRIGDQTVQVSCSMGVALYPRDGDDPTTLMMNADAAMYRAKDLGSNNFQFYAREMNDRLEVKLALLEGMRKALDATLADDGAAAPAGRFHLVYQPKVDLRTGTVFGVEALVRWQHPEHGMVAPLQFIGLAEQSGLIVDLGEWVVRAACLQASAWLAAGLGPLVVSVNVSARQFEETHLVERVAKALRDAGLPPRALELEVTESLLMRDMNQAVERMAALEAMGVSLSIDDFGTGYSSLSALKSFPISTLKIDKSFVRDLAHSPDDQAIALAVISLGHRLQLRVIAEGVETEAQRDFLRANQCDEMQGYLFSPPVSAERITALLGEQALAAAA